jgi:hypothetical protein
LLACLLGAPAVAAANQQAAVPLADRARGAERVVVGRVVSVTPLWRENDFGDRLIMSVLRVSIEETLKGEQQQTVDVEVEGGTIGTLTLRVSDLTPLTAGDRAVFYLTPSRRGPLVPHLRGQGLLKIDRTDRVEGANVTLDEIRRATRSASAIRTPRQ